MTANSVLKVARAHLKDVGTPFRWTTPTLMPFLDIAQRTVGTRRPDALIAEAGTLITLTDISGGTANTNIDLSEKWIDPLAHAVAGHAFMTDARDRTDEARSTKHFMLFESSVKQA